MDQLLSELKANAKKFLQGLPGDIGKVQGALLAGDPPQLIEAYALVAAIQAWRTSIFDRTSQPIREMLLEAQNDGVQSIVLAGSGMWRPALQSLRSCLEASIRIAYFVDHPVELKWWTNQEFTVPIRKTVDEYLPKHPAFASLPAGVGLPDVLGEIKGEYATLSKAVHASAASFLMTKAGNIAVAVESKPDLGKWFTRAKATLGAINLLFLIQNRHLLTGTSHRSLRKMLSAVLPDHVAGLSKQHLGVVLPAKPKK